MSKVTFTKDSNRKKKKTIKEIEKTELINPKDTFDINEMIDIHEKKIGRPSKNKEYGTLRVQKKNVIRVNALQNTLELETQDDLLSLLIDRLENTLVNDEKIMYEMYKKAYHSRFQKKKSLR